MTTLDGIYVLQQKIATIGAGDSVLTWGSLEFFTTIGVTMIDGPFAVSLDIENNTERVIYIGIELDTDNGIVTLADRVHIGHCPPGERVTLSPASIAAMGAIRGTISEMRVKVYPLVNSGTVAVVPRFTRAIVGLAPPPYIGNDKLAEWPGAYTTYIDNAFVVAGSSMIGTQLINNSNRRARIISCMLQTWPTAYPGDVIITLLMRNAVSLVTTMVLGRIASKAEQYHEIAISFDNLYMNSGFEIVPSIVNANAGIAYEYYVSIIAEIIR